jgi:hypothetical protein
MTLLIYEYWLFKAWCALAIAGVLVLAGYGVWKGWGKS